MEFLQICKKINANLIDWNDSRWQICLAKSWGNKLSTLSLSLARRAKIISNGWRASRADLFSNNNTQKRIDEFIYYKFCVVKKKEKKKKNESRNKIDNTQRRRWWLKYGKEINSRKTNKKSQLLVVEIGKKNSNENETPKLKTPRYTFNEEKKDDGKTSWENKKNLASNGFWQRVGGIAINMSPGRGQTTSRATAENLIVQAKEQRSLPWTALHPTTPPKSKAIMLLIINERSKIYICILWICANIFHQFTNWIHLYVQRHIIEYILKDIKIGYIRM